MARLEGKIAIVTGAGSGIGEAVALRFVREGARVIGVSLSDNALKVAEHAGDRMEGRRCDISDPAAVAALMDHCRQAHGRLDVLVNNAAIAPPGFPRLHEASIEQWDAVMNVNQRGAFLVLKYALPLMLESGGAIVNMASIGAFRASPNASAYLTSKGALVSLTRAVAIEYLKDKIRVNAVCPGMTRTALFDGVTEEQMARLLARTPGIRMTEPEEVANLTLFLCSDEASAITGSVYLIDGGRGATG
jgi:meso-butanediol dehydrogenase/(S,S)-butanediol dehydrogenase/diacetyl reductase